jgi:hypothetical protein
MRRIASVARDRWDLCASQWRPCWAQDFCEKSRLFLCNGDGSFTGAFDWASHGSFRLRLDIQGLGMDPRRWRVNPAARSAAGKSFRAIVRLFYVGHPILSGWKSHVLMRQTRLYQCVWLFVTRNGTGSFLISSINSSYLIFDWMNEVISVFCVVGGTRMTGMRIII